LTGLCVGDQAFPAGLAIDVAKAMVKRALSRNIDDVFFHWRDR
jgi:hypothetical protein